MSSSLVLVILTGIAALVYVWFKKYTRLSKENLPPGPPGWPILGNSAVFAGPDRNETFRLYGKKYGGIYSLKAGAVNIITVTSYKYYREAVVDQAWEFAGRPHGMWYSDKTTEKNPGILASGVDEVSKNVRKFSLIKLRSLGFGKSSMQTSMLEECHQLNEEITRHAGKPLDTRNAVSIAAANMIASMAFGRTYKQGDTTLLAITTHISKAIKLYTKSYLVNQILPFLRYIPFFWGQSEAFNQCFVEPKRFLVKIIEQHISTRESGNPRDFLDVWLDENEKSPQSAVELPLERLQNVLMDFFGGGFESTTTSIQWLCAMMLHHEDVQRKVHEELDQKAGRGSQITLELRDSLAYTEAVILETMRMYPVAPFTAPHMATEDGTIAGYRFPKDTQVNFHIYSIHRDPDLWAEPEVFRPERFVKDGLFKVPEHFVAFGMGRRSCIGEQLARKQVFLVFANIVQRFRLSVPAGSPVPPLVIEEGAAMRLPPFKVVFEER